jgi:predicted esterase
MNVMPGRKLSCAEGFEGGYSLKRKTYAKPLVKLAILAGCLAIVAGCTPLIVPHTTPGEVDTYQGGAWSSATNTYQSGNLEYYADSVGGNNFYFAKPKNYDKNATTTYPLFIYLHGSSGRDNLAYLSAIGLGYYEMNFSKQNSAQLASDFRNDHPSFVWVPSVSDDHLPWNTNKLVEQLETIKAAYHINLNKIYLSGFSYGGGATYNFANAYYQQKGQYFAAIVRVASAEFNVDLDPAIFEKTSVWLQVGDQDNTLGSIPATMAVINTAYSNLKGSAFNAGATESSDSTYVSFPQLVETGGQTHSDSCTTSTTSLSKDGLTVAKRTFYVNKGHVVVFFTFMDKRMTDWVYTQSLANR